MKTQIKKIIHKIVLIILKYVSPELRDVVENYDFFKTLKPFTENSSIGEVVKLYQPYHISDSSVGDYTYIASNSNISLAEIGKFCSIGPNFMCGYGIHPSNSVSTHPMFYSTLKQNGISLSAINKITERKKIIIGNDVFIGMNVTILDGVRIGHGAVIGAGAVVVKNVEDYAVVVGVPAKVIKFRFEKEVIDKLLQMKWWDWPIDKLKTIETNCFDITGFINLHLKKQ